MTPSISEQRSIALALVAPWRFNLHYRCTRADPPDATASTWLIVALIANLLIEFS